MFEHFSFGDMSELREPNDKMIIVYHSWYKPIAQFSDKNSDMLEIN